MWQGKHNMKIFDRQKFFRMMFDPPFAVSRLTFGTMPVAARVVTDSYMLAIGSHIYMTTHGSGTTI